MGSGKGGGCGMVVQDTHVVNDLLQGINYEQSIGHCYAQGSDYRTFNEI